MNMLMAVDAEIHPAFLHFLPGEIFPKPFVRMACSGNEMMKSPFPFPAAHFAGSEISVLYHIFCFNLGGSQPLIFSDF